MGGKAFKRIAVTGGAGFIGSHLVDALVNVGFNVRVIDSLDPLVHANNRPPKFLNTAAEFVQQDVRDAQGLERALADTDAVFHLAGAVGVGDSMYKIRHYAEANVLGAANVLNLLAEQGQPIRKIVLASSVTVYGEGKYACARHGSVAPTIRTAEDMAERRWELVCPVREGTARCGEKLTAVATDEEKPATPLSVYAITKKTQEELFLTVGRTYDVDVTVLRYFNVYGSRQSLANPYTGVAKNFAAQFLGGKTPVIYEDGLQTRDFVHVDDIVQANMLALLRPEARGEIFNVGTGKPVSILDMAREIGRQFGGKTAPDPSQQSRAGDVRHCWADTTKIQKHLGYEPRKIFPAGLQDIMEEAGASTEMGRGASEYNDLVERGLVS